MSLSFFKVFVSVVALVFLALPGYIMTKCKLLPKKAGEVLSTFVLFGGQPFMIFMSFQKTYNPQIGKNMLIVAGLAFAVHLIMTLIVCLCVKNKSKDAKINCVRFAGMFANCGFMGFPFIQMLFTGELQAEMMIYGAVIVTVLNIFAWTVGVVMVTGDIKQISLKKIVLNPVIISIVLGFILFITVKVPLKDLFEQGSDLDYVFEQMMRSFDYIGNMVTPLAMVVVGIRLAGIEFKKLFMDKWAYLASFIKLVVMALVSILLVAFIPVDDTVKCAIFLLLSMPSATYATLFAEKYGGDADSASVMILLTTILSIITIPLFYMLFNAVI